MDKNITFDPTKFKLVPLEPTAPMLDAMIRVDGKWSINAIPRLREALRAAIAAAV